MPLRPGPPAQGGPLGTWVVTWEVGTHREAGLKLDFSPTWGRFFIRGSAPRPQRVPPNPEGMSLQKASVTHPDGSTLGFLKL